MRLRGRVSSINPSIGRHKSEHCVREVQSWRTRLERGCGVAQVAFVWLECTRFTGSRDGGSGRRERFRVAGSVYACVYVCFTEPHRPHTPWRTPGEKQGVQVYMHIRIQARLIRIRARADSRCDGCSANILFISADGFSVLARVVVLFFFFFFSRNLKEGSPACRAIRNAPDDYVLPGTPFLICFAIFSPLNGIQISKLLIQRHR